MSGQALWIVLSGGDGLEELPSLLFHQPLVGRYPEFGFEAPQEIINTHVGFVGDILKSVVVMVIVDNEGPEVIVGLQAGVEEPHYLLLVVDVFHQDI